MATITKAPPDRRDFEKKSLFFRFNQPIPGERFRWDGSRGEAEGVYLDHHTYR